MVGASSRQKTGKGVTWREKYLQFRNLVMDGTARIERSERCKEATLKFFQKL